MTEPNAEQESHEKHFDAFISYSSTDRNAARRAYDALYQEGYSVWLDQREVLVGHNVADKVTSGLANSRFVILLLSVASVQSEWVKREWTSAFVEEMDSQDVVILPAMLEQCDIPAVLKSKRYANLVDWDVGIEDIPKAMRAHPRPSREVRREARQVVKELTSGPLRLVVRPSVSEPAEVFVGALLHSPIPYSRFQGMSLLVRVNKSRHVDLTLSQHEVALLGEGTYRNWRTWQWRNSNDVVPCAMMLLDRVRSRHHRVLMPSVGEIQRAMERDDGVILVFVYRDETDGHVVGFGIGGAGWYEMTLTKAVASILV